MGDKTSISPRKKKKKALNGGFPHEAPSPIPSLCFALPLP